MRSNLYVVSKREGYFKCWIALGNIYWFSWLEIASPCKTLAMVIWERGGCRTVKVRWENLWWILLWAFAARLSSPLGTMWRENRTRAGEAAACVGMWCGPQRYLGCMETEQGNRVMFQKYCHELISCILAISMILWDQNHSYREKRVSMTLCLWRSGRPQWGVGPVHTPMRLGEEGAMGTRMK